MRHPDGSPNQIPTEEELRAKYEAEPSVVLGQSHTDDVPVLGNRKSPPIDEYEERLDRFARRAVDAVNQNRRGRLPDITKQEMNDDARKALLDKGIGMGTVKIDLKNKP